MSEVEESLQTLVLQIDGSAPDPAMLAGVIGGPLGVIDALFAIRDKESWREAIDPSDIARIALKSIGLGE